MLLSISPQQHLEDVQNRDREYHWQEDAEGHSQRYRYNRDGNQQGYGLRQQTWERGYNYHTDQNQGRGLSHQQVSENQHQILEEIRKKNILLF